MVPRRRYLMRLAAAVRRSPITAILGPRQCGKTILAGTFSEGRRVAAYFDLESEPDLRRLANPELALGSLRGLVIIDEIQIKPELFRVLRVVTDRPGNRARFLILGSASPDLVKNASETLAGRIEFVELSGFNLEEVGAGAWKTLWLRGGLPRSFLARSQEACASWRENFVKTFLERDIPRLGFAIPSAAMRRFWTMLAHYHGQTWNASEIGRALGQSDKTVRSYLDILSGTFMIRQIQPWFVNIAKRQVKAPRIYFRDSGILHRLLSIDHFVGLLSHPRAGASWEGFALEQIIALLSLGEVYFWGTYQGAELDLLFFKGGRRYGIEAKFNEAPPVTPSMRIALQDLGLDHLWVIYPGKHRYSPEDRITMVPLEKAMALRRELGIKK